MDRAFQLLKVDEKQGLAIGFALVCTEDGEPHFDTQGDHVTEAAMLKAATSFMLHSRKSKEMHRGPANGTVVFCFPLTTEIAKALEIKTKRTGLVIAMKPSPEVLAKFKDGTYTGFSVGGFYGDREKV